MITIIIKKEQDSKAQPTTPSKFDLKVFLMNNGRTSLGVLLQWHIFN
jgi:hypothetical protein